MAAKTAPISNQNTLSMRQRDDMLKSELDTDFNTFLSQYRDLNDFVLPSRGRFFISDVNRGDRRNLKVIDPTGYLASRTLASGMMAGVTSPARPWFRLSTPDPDLAEVTAVKIWLHTVSQRMQATFSKSNLYNVLPVVYGDLGTFGTAAFMIEEDDEDIFRFYSFEVGTYRLAKDRRGKVNVFLREFRLTVRQTVEMFAQKDNSGNIDWSNISNYVRNLWETQKYESWIDIVHIIEPNAEYDPRKLDSKFKKFQSRYYERGTSGQMMRGTSSQADAKYLRVKGYDYFPVMAPRWQTTGQDVYGTDCPGMVAIGDIKQLQHSEKRGLQALDKKINPPMVGPNSLKTTKASIISGDVTYLSDEDLQRGGFKPAHEVQLRLDELEVKQAQIRDRINRAYFVDLFLMLSQSDRKDITATEILERKEEKLLAIGPVLEQLNQDVLDPLIDNAFLILNRAGLIPEPPEELQGVDLKVEYISVMAQAQKLIAIGGIERLANFAVQIIQANPQSADKVDFDQIIDEYAEAIGVSPRLIRSDEVVESIRAAAAQAMKAQQQTEMLAKSAGAAKDLAGASLEGDNALNRLLQTAQAGAVT